MRVAPLLVALSVVSCAQRQGTVPPSPSPPGDGATVVAVGYVKPKESTPGCLKAQLEKLPDSIWFPDHALFVTVKFAVMRDGKTQRLQTMTPVSDDLREFLGQAIAACEWVPGKDDQGRAISVWVAIPLRLVKAAD